MPKLADKKTSASKSSPPKAANGKKGAAKTTKPAAAPTTPVAAETRENAPSDMTEILYPEIELRKCLGDSAMTVAQAKELLGWEDEEEYAARLSGEVAPDNEKGGKAKSKPPVVKFGDVYDLVDHHNRKVRLWRNTNNRDRKSVV